MIAFNIRRGRLALAALIVIACSPEKALEVSDIDVLAPDVLDTKQGLPALVAGNASSFQRIQRRC